MAHQPSVKQKQFVKAYVKCGNGVKAALQTYDTTDPNTAGQIAYHNLRSQKVIRYMDKILDNSGLSDEKIASSLDKIVTAGTSDGALKAAKPADALRAVEMASRMKDLFPAQKKEVETKNATLRISLQSKSQDELVQYITDLKEEAVKFRQIVERAKLARASE